MNTPDFKNECKNNENNSLTLENFLLLSAEIERISYAYISKEKELHNLRVQYKNLLDIRNLSQERENEKNENEHIIIKEKNILGEKNKKEHKKSISNEITNSILKENELDLKILKEEHRNLEELYKKEKNSLEKKFLESEMKFFKMESEFALVTSEKEKYFIIAKEAELNLIENFNLKEIISEKDKKIKELTEKSKNESFISHKKSCSNDEFYKRVNSETSEKRNEENLIQKIEELLRVNEILLKENNNLNRNVLLLEESSQNNLKNIEENFRKNIKQREEIENLSEKNRKLKQQIENLLKEIEKIMKKNEEDDENNLLKNLQMKINELNFKNSELITQNYQKNGEIELIKSEKEKYQKILKEKNMIVENNLQKILELENIEIEKEEIEKNLNKILLQKKDFEKKIEIILKDNDEHYKKSVELQEKLDFLRGEKKENLNNNKEIRALEDENKRIHNLINNLNKKLLAKSNEIENLKQKCFYFEEVNKVSKEMQRITLELKDENLALKEELFGQQTEKENFYNYKSSRVNENYSTRIYKNWI